MNRNQVLQHLYRLQQHAVIFDREIRVALNLAMLELNGEGKAETPEKVRKIFDEIEKETNRLVQMHRSQSVLDSIHEEKLKDGEKR